MFDPPDRLKPAQSGCALKHTALPAAAIWMNSLRFKPFDIDPS
jgi:hypothetical protein